MKAVKLNTAETILRLSFVTFLLVLALLMLIGKTLIKNVFDIRIDRFGTSPWNSERRQGVA